MRKGEFTWKETIYQDVTVAEIPKVVMKLLVDRDPADGSPVKVEPECDGTYTISHRWFESSEWDDEDHERPMSQEEVNHLCDTCPEAHFVNIMEIIEKFGIESLSGKKIKTKAENGFAVVITIEEAEDAE